MRRLVLVIASRTYHIVGNLISLVILVLQCSPLHSVVFPIDIGTINIGLPIMYFNGSQVKWSNDVIMYLNDVVILATVSANPFAEIYLSLHGFLKYPFRGF